MRKWLFVGASLALVAFCMPARAQEAKKASETPRFNGLYHFSVDTMTQGPPMWTFLRFYPDGKLALLVHIEAPKPGDAARELATIVREEAKQLKFRDGKQRGDGSYDVQGQKLSGYVLQHVKDNGGLDKVAFEFAMKEGVLTLKKGSLGILGGTADKKCEFVEVSFPDQTKDKP